MSYTVRFAPAAKRKISGDTWPFAVLDAAIAFIKRGLSDKPKVVGKPLRGALAGTYAARRGTYRILYKIDDVRELLTIVDIDHRRNVYRPR